MKEFHGLNFLTTFIIMAVFWIFLSGFLDSFHLALGGICCALVALLSHGLLFTESNLRQRHMTGKNFILYLPWLLYQIILANIHVAYLILHPKMPIDPKIIRFKTKWKGDMALVTMANSITLTPGTITLDIRQGEYWVHALSGKVADDLLAGKMQDRVGAIFGEKEWRVYE